LEGTDIMSPLAGFCQTCYQCSGDINIWLFVEFNYNGLFLIRSLLIVV
jgi:hypothetical protein